MITCYLRYVINPYKIENMTFNADPNSNGLLIQNSVTDYFTIEGYKAIKGFREQGRLQNIFAILPNIEFRLKNIVSGQNGEEKRLNFHVIFSEEVPVGNIEEHFLHDIPFYYQGDPQNPDERRKLKISNLEALGKN